MTRFWAICGAVNAFLAVAAGAFGAHALKQRLTPELLNTFEVGARYHMYHAFGLWTVAFAASQGRRVDAAGWAMLAGIVLFSVSLYTLALSGFRPLGMIAPLGGLAFLGAWAILGWSFLYS